MTYLNQMCFVLGVVITLCGCTGAWIDGISQKTANQQRTNNNDNQNTTSGSLTVSATTIAVIVNDQDPQSVAVANYYQQQRNIPEANMIHISFQPRPVDLDHITFNNIKSDLDNRLDAKIQAQVLTWTYPYRVRNTSNNALMSITSAFTFGVNANSMQTLPPSGCVPPNSYDDSPLYDHQVSDEGYFSDLGLRPTMMLAGDTIDEVKDLIDRGVLADGGGPIVKGFFLRTRDQIRSGPRLADWQATTATYAGTAGTDLQYVDHSATSEFISGESNIMIYQTGAAIVEDIATNTYLPGAIADHLTSNGGFLDGNIPSQMSILEWLRAGVTGSYGTVREPCASLNKFPQASIIMKYYLAGETLIEAYWKSVRDPYEGIFVGEPLATIR